MSLFGIGRWVGLLGLLAGGCTAGNHPINLHAATAALTRGDTRAAVEICAEVVQREPDSGAAAFAADIIVELTGARILPETEVTCSTEAGAVYAQAETHFVAQRLSDALLDFQRAVELCPANAKWWIHAGDVYYGAGDYERAKDLFVQGLKLDPWNRTGQKFLADTELQLGDLDASYRHAVLTVISDPTYETGWHLLREFTEALGGKWHRTRPGDPAYWSELAKSIGAGYVEEAIYLHRLDPGRAPAYRAYREAHTERLIEYITKVVAPLPPSDARHT
ncbi:MAG TPA: tetratricopeptide repeat protein [Terriglobales bacterium]|nr:tetratricopeptide repeat protein [Terriglobales bacterium]